MDKLTRLCQKRLTLITSSKTFDEINAVNIEIADEASAFFLGVTVTMADGTSVWDYHKKRIEAEDKRKNKLRKKVTA
jgi:hypothetical protein